MKTKLKANAEIDILSGPEFHAGIKSLRDTFTELLKERPVQRMRVSQVGNAAAAATTCIVRIPGPKTGRQWNVRQIRVSGPVAADGSIPVINGHATIYRIEPAAQNYIDSTNKAGATGVSGLPNLSDAGTNERIFNSGEDIVAVFFGLAASQTGLTLTADVIDEPAAKFEAVATVEETA